MSPSGMGENPSPLGEAFRLMIRFSPAEAGGLGFSKAELVRALRK